MRIYEYDPPDPDDLAYVLSVACFEPWPFVATHIALDANVVSRRIREDGRLTTITTGAWSLKAGDFLVQLSNGETVHALDQKDLDLYANRTCQA